MCLRTLVSLKSILWVWVHLWTSGSEFTRLKEEQDTNNHYLSTSLKRFSLCWTLQSNFSLAPAQPSSFLPSSQQREESEDHLEDISLSQGQKPGIYTTTTTIYRSSVTKTDTTCWPSVAWELPKRILSQHPALLKGTYGLEQKQSERTTQAVKISQWNKNQGRTPSEKIYLDQSSRGDWQLLEVGSTSNNTWGILSTSVLRNCTQFYHSATQPTLRN